MKIATFNLRNLFDAGHRESYGNAQVLITREFVASVVVNLSNTIKKISPDILAAQEVGSEKVFNELAHASGDLKTFVAKPDTRGIGNAMLFKGEMECASIPDIAGFPVFAEGQEDVIGGTISPRRDFIYAKTLYNGKPLHIFNVHLKASIPISLIDKDGGKKKETTQREAGDGIIRANLYKLAEARRLRELTDELFLADHEAQIIITGDFNDASDTAVLNIIKGGLWSDNTTQLKDLCDNVPPEKRFSFMGFGSKRLIDHMLVSPSLTQSVVSVEILNDDLVDQSGRPESDFIDSDHAPVVLTLK